MRLRELPVPLEFGQTARWCQNDAKDVEEPQQEVEFGGLLGQFVESLASELSLQRKGHGDGEQGQGQADAAVCGQDAENQVGQEEQRGVEHVGEGGADEDGERDDARLPVGLHVPGVVGMEDGLRAQGEGDGVDQWEDRQGPHLDGVGEHHGQWAEGDEDDEVSQSHVLESNAYSRKTQRVGVSEVEGWQLRGCSPVKGRPFLAGNVSAYTGEWVLTEVSSPPAQNLISSAMPRRYREH